MSTPQSINRLLISRGPALVTFRGASFLSADDMVLDLGNDSKDIPSSAIGTVGSIRVGAKPTLKFKPVGEWESLAVLFPYATQLQGSSIFGTADYPLIIQPIDTAQPQCRFKAGAISKMPDLMFSATETLLGDVEFSFIPGAGALNTDAARYFLFETNALPGTLPYSDAAVITQAYQARWMSAGTYTLTWGGDTTTALDWDSTAVEVAAALNVLASIIAAGNVTVTGDVDNGYAITFTTHAARALITATGAATLPPGTTVTLATTTVGSAGVSAVQSLVLSPWNNFPTESGLKVTFNLATEAKKADALGIYDYLFKDLTVEVSGKPIGPSITAALAAIQVQGALSIPGTRMAAGAHHLDIIGDGVFFRAYSAAVSKGGLTFGAANERVNDMTWKTSRTLDGSTLNPLFFVGTAAP